jgi:hypothetical protein
VRRFRSIGQEIVSRSPKPAQSGHVRGPLFAMIIQLGSANPYSAKAGIGFFEKNTRKLLNESIFLPQTGFHFAGKCSTKSFADQGECGL